MPEHYAPAQLQRTKGLYEKIKALAAARQDITLIGGWAVYERVEERRAMQSRDVDIVLHSESALKAVEDLMREAKLVWRTSGRKRFPDAHFADEDPMIFRLDAFTTQTNPTWDMLFGRAGAGNVKSCPQVLVPTVQWLVADKLRTLQLRSGPDAADKRAKDLIDVYNLVFHNREGHLPKELRAATEDDACRAAMPWLTEAKEMRPEYAEPFGTLRNWLG